MTASRETNQEHFKGYAQKKSSERGAALVYVLIAIALFAALSFTLSRQTDSNEANSLDEERAEIYATQLISTAAQIKSAVDQMLFSGSQINDLNFELPTDANFETGTVIHKVYHPQGGGITPPRFPSDMGESTGTTDPAPGWYMGRFNNVEWTATTAQDAMLTAWRLNPEVCAKINEKITGSSTIPALGPLRSRFINGSLYSGTNNDLLTDPSGTPFCADCHNIASLCVTNASQNMYLFYTIIADQ